MNFIKKGALVLVMLVAASISAFAETRSISTEFTINVPEYLNIRPITSPVLTANITNRTGNLYAPLSTRFRVATNTSKTKIAFANLAKIPKASSLANCKIGSLPKDSPGIVAYPVTSVTGAEHRFVSGKEEYEVYVNNGITDITVNVGSNVLRNSFAANDPRGFYQATLSLTEAEG